MIWFSDQVRSGSMLTKNTIAIIPVQCWVIPKISIWRVTSFTQWFIRVHFYELSSKNHKYLNEIIKTWIHFKDSKSCTVKNGSKPFFIFGCVEDKGGSHIILFRDEFDLRIWHTGSLWVCSSLIRSISFRLRILTIQIQAFSFRFLKNEKFFRSNTLNIM